MSEKLKTQIKLKFNIFFLPKKARREELLAGQGVSNTGAIVLALRD